MKILSLIKKLFYLFLFVLGLAFLVFTLPIQPPREEITSTGLTFSVRAAEFLESDWKRVYRSMLDELDPEIIRIPVYWDRLEREEGKYDWSELDYQFDQLNGKSTKVILAIGAKVPRWPECHIPEWIAGKQESEKIESLNAFMTQIVTRYKSQPNLTQWQVGNEVLFPFGECPKWVKSRSRLKEAIELVSKLDPDHSVMTTDSGELSTWLRTATLPVDTLGISLYRVAYNESRGYFHWPVNPYFYRVHKWLVSPFIEDLVITELQLEAWGPDIVQNLSDEQIADSMHPDEITKRYEFATRTGASTILGWGVEWWYYMKEVRDQPQYWNEAKELFESL